MSENKWNFEMFQQQTEEQAKPQPQEEQTPQQEVIKAQEVENKSNTELLEKIKKFDHKRIVKYAFVLLLILIIISGLGSCFKGCSDSSVDDPVVDENSPEVIAQRTVDKAKINAAQYNYDAAISAVMGLDGYEEDEELKSLVSSWEQEKSTLVEFPHEKITHIFFHSLVQDAGLAFDSSKGNEAMGYNLVMTTVDEFNKIIQSMYEKGFVMVSIHDICTFDENGKRVDHKIMLPPDKKAFVLSQDDLNYYHFQDGDGIATKLIIDKDGKVKNEYITRKGETVIGDFDVVPIIDTFVEKHPDFSYKGHKGILALTGYNGVLGYRTDSVYNTLQDLDIDQQQFLDANPDFDYEKEVEQAKKVADAMKESGWEFASHTWGHITVPNTDMGHLDTDCGKWKSYVESIIGSTDVLIFPNGSDLAGTEEYDSYNERFNYLSQLGFRIFCPVDSTMYWQQKGDNYFRMSRRNLDGYRMYHNPELLTDLFDVSEVFDPKRPTPLPTMSEVYG